MVLTIKLHIRILINKGVKNASFEGGTGLPAMSVGLRGVVTVPSGLMASAQGPFSPLEKQPEAMEN